ncbi:MAG: hypothetical protein V1787_03635 [Candidatus Micrarchaeota archaeon]
MPESLEKALACLRVAGLNPKIGSFSDRLVIQKGTFLLQKLGVKLGYQFNLYIHGPYSKALTDELYANEKVLNKSGKDIKLTAKEEEACRELNAIGFNPSLLEIISTFVILADDLKYSQDEALTRLRTLKPKFSESEIILGTSKAREFVLKPTKSETVELKKTLTVWEKAGAETMAKAA